MIFVFISICQWVGFDKGVMKDVGLLNGSWVQIWVPPAKPAWRLSAHVPSSHDNVGEISASFSPKRNGGT